MTRGATLLLFGGCLLAALGLGPQETQAVLLDDVSFKAPFERVDNEGKRIVNDTWTYGGSTEVKKHFVRLTTDRQSKKGFLWRRQPIERDTLSAILTFRISGVGKTWFGDGIGLWFTNHKGFAQGSNHGFTDKFSGVGVVIDTFVNSEHKGGHKDISVQINDGTKTLNQLNDEQRQGCDAAVRYYEQSALFDPVHSMSRIKVKIDGQRLVLEVDATASGRWVACYDGRLPFAADWLKSATIGITGATGALADNHDVLRFDAYSEFSDSAVGATDAEVIMHSVSKDYKKWMDSPNCGTDCLIAVLQKELSNFRIEAEHRFTDVKEKTTNTVEKLRKQEKENELRVKQIEQRISKNIDTTLDNTQDKIGTEVNAKITKQLEENPNIAGGGGWKTPFLLLVLALGVLGTAVYRKYQALMKSHLL